MKSGWSIKTLGEFAAIGAGNPAPQDERLFLDGTYPFFRTADAGRIRFGNIRDTTDYLNEAGIKGLRLSPKGTILFPKSGASAFLNHRVMLAVDGFVSSHLATILPDPRYVDGRYVLYFLATIVAQDLIQDHAYPSLKLPDIAGISIPVPGRPEQRRIVAILDEAFRGIAAAKANTARSIQNAHAVLENYVSGILESASSQWSCERFGKLATLRNGVNFTKASTGETINIVGVKDFQDNFMAPMGELAKVQVDGAVEPADLVEKDDLLFVRSNGSANLVGRCLLVGDVEERTTHSGFTIRARLTTSRASAQFVSRLVRSARMRKELIAGGEGVGIKSLNQGTLAQLELPIPPLATQDRLCAIIDEVEADTRRLSQIYNDKLDALEQLKKSLLHQAFSGQL